ncbi:hypothetical protein BJX62DRAFT_212514, partial [Aspergillus germanicus]
MREVPLRGKGLYLFFPSILSFLPFRRLLLCRELLFSIDICTPCAPMKVVIEPAVEILGKHKERTLILDIPSVAFFLSFLNELVKDKERRQKARNDLDGD